MHRPYNKLKKFLFASNAKMILLQATLWERFAKLSPLIISIIMLTLYLTGSRHWELVKDGLVIFLIIFAAVWWLWIIYTIATIAQILDKSQHGLKDIILDLREVHKEINNIRKEG